MSGHCSFFYPSGDPDVPDAPCRGQVYCGHRITLTDENDVELGKLVLWACDEHLPKLPPQRAQSSRSWLDERKAATRVAANRLRARGVYPTVARLEQETDDLLNEA